MGEKSKTRILGMLSIVVPIKQLYLLYFFALLFFCTSQHPSSPSPAIFLRDFRGCNAAFVLSYIWFIYRETCCEVKGRECTHSWRAQCCDWTFIIYGRLIFNAFISCEHLYIQRRDGRGILMMDKAAMPFTLFNRYYSTASTYIL